MGVVTDSNREGLERLAASLTVGEACFVRRVFPGRPPVAQRFDPMREYAYRVRNETTLKWAAPRAVPGIVESLVDKGLLRRTPGGMVRTTETGEGVWELLAGTGWARYRASAGKIPWDWRAD